MHTPLDALLLVRTGRLVLRGAPGGGPAPDLLLRAVDLELLQLGFALTYRARRALATLDPAALTVELAWIRQQLAASLGANQRHESLFRRFPADVPRDTLALWFKKFLGFWLQEPDAPCLTCAGVGTTHVLSPCLHVVCDRCFDGSNWSACPVCERQVDRTSPFFRPTSTPEAPPGPSPVAVRRIDLCVDPEGDARALLLALTGRAQAMSATDVAALTVLVQAYGLAVLPLLPAVIPVRENVAHVFGTLARTLPAADVLDAARPHLRTATDVLRLLAVWAGASAALQSTPRRVPAREEEAARWSGEPRRLAVEGVLALRPELRAWIAKYTQYATRYLEYWQSVEIASPRFKPPKLGRPARRAVLAVLDALPEESLLEDMSRHASAWVRMGEALHPGEYTDRYPRAARGFRVVRGAEAWHGFASTTERLRLAGDGPGLVAHLRARPGELWRRADHLLRTVADPAVVVDALVATVDRPAVPLLLGLAAQLPRRDHRWPVRVFFPKGAFFEAPSTSDRRPLLPPERTGPLVDAIERELLARFARLPRVATALLDEAAADVVVPFNERTSAKSAVALPRGSTLAIPDAEILRLFLHWCEPAKGEATDIDLSIALYDSGWNHTGVCSYYELNLGPVAVHSGDLRDAPPPHGASEFVDLDRRAALAAGHRYAVMVVNAYSGLPFASLDRAFAGVMRRTRAGGPHFDPATVALKFDVGGTTHGTYVPLGVDLVTGRLEWLDVCSGGQIALNNVATSNRDITRIVPAIRRYFAEGARPTMWDLGVLHAAARADAVRIRLRDGGERHVVRRPGDEPADLLARIRLGEADPPRPMAGPALAVLVHGDLELPEGSTAWALFREQLTGTIAASDLLTVPA